MSKELSVTYSTAAANLYVILRRKSDDYVWNGSALVAWNNANIATYAIPLPDQGGDVYAADMPSTLPVGNYRAIYYERASGTPAITDLLLTSETFRWTGIVSSIPPGDAWYYSDRTGVLTVQDAANIIVVWDQDNDGIEDAGLMASDGATADGYIDLALINLGRTIASNGHAVDLTTAAVFIIAALGDISNHLTVWYGWHHRGGIERVAKPNEIAGLMSGYKTYADEQLVKLAAVLALDDEATASDRTIKTLVGDPKQYPGTGWVRPPVITVPTLTGNASW